jgi:threonine synthase
MIAERTSLLTHLTCSVCHKPFDADRQQTYAQCESCGQAPLLANYELHTSAPADVIKNNVRSMWRYFDLMPLRNKDNIVSLGEGLTPLMELKRIASVLELKNLLIKEESLNPTGSFKSRGMSAAISKAKELGVKKCIVPTAGNAGVAMSAYCAKANMESIVVMPFITPPSFVKECQVYGSQVILMEGLIDNCAKKVAELNRDNEYFNLSTMKEPYRLEGKKTMGYEIVEQMNWQLPDVILYPTGGGTGLIGMWKAFHEMKKMGWINCALPRMYAVQTELCEPVVKAFWGNESKPDLNKKASIAYGLNVPKPFALRLILQVLNDSGGEALSVTEQEILDSTKQIIKSEGIFLAPEGGALLAALRKLLVQNKISHDEKILILNTGGGEKYLGAIF